MDFYEPLDQNQTSNDSYYEPLDMQNFTAQPNIGPQVFQEQPIERKKKRKKDFGNQLLSMIDSGYARFSDLIGDNQTTFPTIGELLNGRDRVAAQQNAAMKQSEIDTTSKLIQLPAVQQNNVLRQRLTEKLNNQKRELFKQQMTANAPWDRDLPTDVASYMFEATQQPVNQINAAIGGFGKFAELYGKDPRAFQKALREWENQAAMADQMLQNRALDKQKNNVSQAAFAFANNPYMMQISTTPEFAKKHPDLQKQIDNINNMFSVYKAATFGTLADIGMIVADPLNYLPIPGLKFMAEAGSKVINKADDALKLLSKYDKFITKAGQANFKALQGSKVPIIEQEIKQIEQQIEKQAAKATIDIEKANAKQLIEKANAKQLIEKANAKQLIEKELADVIEKDATNIVTQQADNVAVKAVEDVPKNVYEPKPNPLMEEIQTLTKEVNEYRALRDAGKLTAEDQQKYLAKLKELNSKYDDLQKQTIPDNERRLAMVQEASKATDEKLASRQKVLETVEQARKVRPDRIKKRPLVEKWEDELLAKAELRAAKEAEDLAIRKTFLGLGFQKKVEQIGIDHSKLPADIKTDVENAASKLLAKQQLTDKEIAAVAKAYREYPFKAKPEKPVKDSIDAGYEAINRRLKVQQTLSGKEVAKDLGIDFDNLPRQSKSYVEQMAKEIFLQGKKPTKYEQGLFEELALMYPIKKSTPKPTAITEVKSKLRQPVNPKDYKMDLQLFAHKAKEESIPVLDPLSVPQEIRSSKQYNDYLDLLVKYKNGDKIDIEKLRMLQKDISSKSERINKNITDSDNWDLGFEARSQSIRKYFELKNKKNITQQDLDDYHKLVDEIKQPNEFWKKFRSKGSSYTEENVNQWRDEVREKYLELVKIYEKQQNDGFNLQRFAAKKEPPSAKDVADIKAIKFAVKARETAITRSKPAVPTQQLVKDGRFSGDVLHHGRGKDVASTAEIQKQPGVNLVEEYDFNFKPDRSVLNRKYDNVVSNYVLNTLPPEIRKNPLQDIANTVAPDGKGFISVRGIGDTSIKGTPYADGVITSKGTFQKGYTPEDFKKELLNYFEEVDIIYGKGKNPGSITAEVRKPRPIIDETAKAQLKTEPIKQIESDPITVEKQVKQLSKEEQRQVMKQTAKEVENTRIKQVVENMKQPGPKNCIKPRM